MSGARLERTQERAWNYGKGLKAKFAIDSSGSSDAKRNIFVLVFTCEETGGQLHVANGLLFSTISAKRRSKIQD